MIKEALIMVDVQNDFCPNGSLAVTDGDSVVEPLNRMAEVIRAKGGLVFASRDWHRSDNTLHFAKWPEHCIQETEGAEFHKDLNLTGVEVISKGTENADDGYSAFQGKMADGGLLEDALRKAGVTRVLVGGLATDYCVSETAIDAVDEGFEVYLLQDACRAVNIHEMDGQRALDEMVKNGVKLSSSIREIERYVQHL